MAVLNVLNIRAGMTPRILIIAGSDSGGGAGIQADIKTVTMLGGHAMTAVTAVTAQNTLGVETIYPIPDSIVVQQMSCVVEDLGVDAVKIGMLGGPSVASAIADALACGLYPSTIVFDPVMVATSGSMLADSRTIEAMDRLARLSMLVTPNLPELAVLCGREALDRSEIEAEATEYARRIGAVVLMKGGHDGDGDVVDRLIGPDGEMRRWTNPRIDTVHTHGTGCTLASAIATGLGEGRDLYESIARGIRFVRLALINAPGLGQGSGPIGHALGVSPFDKLEG